NLESSPGCCGFSLNAIIIICPSNAHFPPFAFIYSISRPDSFANPSIPNFVNLKKSYGTSWCGQAIGSDPIKQPPGFRTLEISKKAFLWSYTCSNTCVHSTVSKEASLNAKLVAGHITSTTLRLDC